jgi:hypothetical protein
MVILSEAKNLSLSSYWNGKQNDGEILRRFTPQNDEPNSLLGHKYR